MGRGSAAEDVAESRRLLDAVATGALPGAVRVWKPVPALALSRLDERRPGADVARSVAVAAGYEVTRRISGGHAVLLGPGTLCVGAAEPAATFTATQDRYERFTDALVGALATVGVTAERGELPGEWCPGAWSVRAGGVKLAGVAQRAIKAGAWTEAVIELSPRPQARAVLREVYAALELPLDPATLGSVSEVAGREVGFAELEDALRAALGGR
jgi:lipoate-protein ligase A